MFRGSGAQEQEPRGRHACEPCRRKKSKCTGERPICSFCRRLNQECIYLPRARPNANADEDGVTKPSPAAGSGARRLRKLGFRADNVQQMLQRLRSSPRQQAVSSRESTESPPGQNADPSHTPESPGGRPSFSLIRPKPPPAVLDHLVAIYRTTFHLQPLPLFSLDYLQTRLISAPEYLLNSFLALTVPFSDHEFYSGDKKATAIRLYTRSAENLVMSLAFDGAPRLEAEQCLCLLAMNNMLARNPSKAWMAIGTASRLETLRSTTRRDSRISKDEVSRCHWSIFVLERTFFPQLSVSQLTAAPVPDHPNSAKLPSALPAPADGKPTDPLGGEIREDSTWDLGINAYYMNWLSVWADLAVYLRNIRLGDTEIPWSENSTYAKLSVKLFDCESKLPDRHLLRYVNFHRRPPADLHSQLDYWAPWFAMQVISHAVTALLNHPYIHMSAMRRARVPQSRHFLQQTVDQALFHAGWVFRLVGMCEDQLFEVRDPLIAHVVAATVTIPWLFQFAADVTVSTRAKEDLRKSDRLLRRMSRMWPHLARKVEILESLQSIANEELLRSSGDQNRHIILPLSELWELLDPNTLQGQSGQGSNDAAAHPFNPQDPRMRISTHIVHPLVENNAEPSSSGSGVTGPADPFSASNPCGQLELEQVSLDDLFSQLVPEQLQWWQA